jgi:transmembrane sensor
MAGAMKPRTDFVSDATAIVLGSTKEFFEPLALIARTLRRRLVRNRMLFQFGLLVVAGGLEVSPRSPADIYRADIGQIKHVYLSHGVLTILNSDSRILVKNRPSGCAVEVLQGEAAFRTNSSTSVVVTAAGVTLQSTRSMFSVRLTDLSSVEVFVSEGQVTIDAPVRAEVSSSQIADIHNGTIRISPLPLVDVYRRLSWTEGLLDVTNTTLREVVAEFNHYNNSKLVIDDPTLGELRISGMFPFTEPERFASEVSMLFNSRVSVRQTQRGREIHLSRK